MMKFTIEDNASLQQATNLTATELLEVVTELTDASAEMQALVGEVKEMDLVLENVRHAHNTLVDIGASAEALAVFNADGQLAAFADVQAEMENVAALSGKALESVAQKIDAALEEQKEGLWARFKEWGKKVIAAIRRFFGTLWTWLKGTFQSHGKPLTWKEAQAVYDMEKGAAEVANAIKAAFEDPDFEKAMQNMAAEMAKAFEDPKVQELAAEKDFGSNAGAANEVLTINGQDSGGPVDTGLHWISYRSAVDALNKCGLGKGVSQIMKGTADDIRIVKATISKLSSPEYNADETVLKEMRSNQEELAKVAASEMTVLDMIKTTAKFDPDTFRIEFNSEISEPTGTPSSTGWNLRTVREYMQNFDRFCNGGAGFNVNGALSVVEKEYDSILTQLDEMKVQSATTGKVRAYVRSLVQLNADLTRFYGIMARIVYAQVKTCTHVLARIKAEMRKSARGANKSA